MLGIRSRGTDWDYDVTRCHADGQQFGGMRYAYEKLAIRRARVLGSNHRHDPLIWEIPFGRGRCILSAVPYGQDVAATDLLPLFKHILGGVLDELLLVKAEPATLEWIVNRGEGWLLVGAFNHEATAWKGRVRVKNQRGAHAVRELWRGSHVRVRRQGSDLLIEDSIEPFELRLYRVETGQSAKA